jgi:hypothetical protein
MSDIRSMASHQSQCLEFQDARDIKEPKGFMKEVGSRRRTQNTYGENENEDEVHPGLRGRSSDL